MLRNSQNRFGLIAIFLHWLVAIAILGLFAVGWYMVELSYYDALYNTLPDIHKSIGMLLVPVFLFKIFWTWYSPPPPPLVKSPLERIGARLMHVLLLLLIGVILFSGYLIPTAEGAPIDVFGWFSVPAGITSIPAQEDLAGVVHEYSSYALIALVVLHALAALKHHFINRDNSLRRMLGGPAA